MGFKLIGLEFLEWIGRLQCNETNTHNNHNRRGLEWNWVGVSLQDNETAVMWYTKAAEQGYAEAQYNLGFMYASGEGVPENDVKAYVWWSMAKANGNKSAKDNIEVLKSMMTKEQIAKAQEIGSKCYESDYKDCN